MMKRVPRMPMVAVGVATWSYAPYAIFSIVSPLLTIAVAFADRSAGCKHAFIHPIANKTNNTGVAAIDGGVGHGKGKLGDIASQP